MLALVLGLQDFLVRSLWAPHNFSQTTAFIIIYYIINAQRHIQQGERGVAGEPGNPGVKGEKVRIKILLTFVIHTSQFSSGEFI